MSLLSMVATFFALTNAVGPFTINMFHPDAEISYLEDLKSNPACESVPNDGYICKNAFSHILGVRPKASRLIVSQNRYARFYFSSDHSDFAKISDAMVAKLGRPSMTKTIRLTDENSGNGLSSVKQTWNLKSGQLVLTERSYLSDQFSFRFSRH